MAQDIINSEKNAVSMDDQNFDALSEFIAESPVQNIKKKKRKLLLNKNKS